MDDLNITMEEYIRLEEEKARRRGKVYNWETATYGKIWYNEDVHDLRSVETEFPAIVLNDALTSEVTLSCEPTVSPLNDNKIDFRISFDESNDEDYTPTVSYFDDLDYFKDFETEFPAIVYNDALTSKLNFLTEPTGKHHQADSFILGVSIFKHITYSEEFVNVFVWIGFDSTIELVSFDKSQVVTFNGKFICGFRNGYCRTGSRSDNTIGSQHGFIIHGIEVLKGNEKVTEVIDVENWRVDNSRLFCFFVRMELFCFVDEVFDSEYVQVQVMVQQVQSWKHVYASKGEFV
ncbi:hypothetical protein Tco_0612588 [Tanacetum coccineum]